MSRTGPQWRTFAEELLARVTPAFVRPGLAPDAGFSVRLGGPFLVSLDAADPAVVLGFPDSDEGADATARWADLLGAAPGPDVDRALECLVVRLTLYSYARHLRVRNGAASEDDWVESQVAAAVSHAATARLFAPHREFLIPFLSAASDGLHQRRLLSLPGDDAGGPAGAHLLAAMGAFLADLGRDDVPALDETLEALVSGPDRATRQRAESELVLLKTLTDGPPGLRRTAAELFAEEAGAEAIAKLLSGPRAMPPDVRLMLAQALQLRGAGADAAPHLAALAAGARTPAPVAAAATLLLDEPTSDEPAARLAELEDAGLADTLRFVKELRTPASVTAVWPLLAHPAAPARREAYRLLANLLPEGDAWTGACDPEPAIRAASVRRLSPRPGLARAISALLLDESREVRAAALERARAHPMVANDVCALLASRETDDARLAMASVLAAQHPDAAEDLLGRVLARTLRPYATTLAAARALPADALVSRVEALARDALARRRRELLTSAAEALGRPDWVALLDAADQDAGPDADEAARALETALPLSFAEAFADAPAPPEPAQALRGLAVAHPEPFVRAALLLWLAGTGRVSAEEAATLAEQDPTGTVAEVARVLRAPPEDRMTLTAVEKALFLRTVPLFRSVPTPNLLAIAAAMRATSHAPGELVVRQGEIGDRLFVLYEGTAQARKELPGGAPAPLATLGTGAVFGEMSLFDSEPRSASVVAVEPCRTLMLEGEAFHRLGTEYPEILWEVCRVLTRRLRTLGQGVAAKGPTRAA